MLLLSLDVKFLRRSPWFYVEGDYLYPAVRQQEDFDMQKHQLIRNKLTDVNRFILSYNSTFISLLN